MVILFVKYDSFSPDVRFSSQAGKNHASIVDRLTRTFVVATRGRAIVRVQGPVLLGEHSEPGPDLTLLRPRADYYRDAAPGAADVLIILDVADSTQRHDGRVKVPLYARHGVPEVWVIDLENRPVHFHRGPSADGYADVSASEQPGVTPVPALVAIRSTYLGGSGGISRIRTGIAGIDNAKKRAEFSLRPCNFPLRACA